MFLVGNTLRDEAVEHEPAYSIRAVDPYRCGLLDSRTVSGVLNDHVLERYGILSYAV